MSETGENNILNQLRNKRNRASVTPRQDALVPKPEQQTQAASSTTPLSELTNTNVTEVQQHSQQDIEREGEQPTTDKDAKLSTDDSITSLKAELEKYPQTKRHSAIVLEKDLSIELTQFCKQRGITVETFLEAAWTVVNSDDALVLKITAEAKRRYDQRKRVGQIKRLITMLSNSY